MRQDAVPAGRGGFVAGDWPSVLRRFTESQKGSHKSSSASKAKRLAGGGGGARAGAVGVA